MSTATDFAARIAAIYASECAPVAPAAGPTAAGVRAAVAAETANGYDERAYISDVAARLGVSVAALAPVLVDFNRTGVVVLWRADLVGAMDGAKLDASEIGTPIMRSVAWHLVSLR